MSTQNEQSLAAVPVQFLPQLSELLSTAVEAAEAAAALIHQMRREGVHVAAAKSSIVDVVTDADRAAEKLIIEKLTARRPHDSVLGEEEGDSVTGTSGVTWLVDPIDGTVNYLYNIPAYAVSVAAAISVDPSTPGSVDGWLTLVGCVFNPSTGERYTAQRGGGSFLNGERLSVNPVERLESSLVGTGFGYTSEKRRAQGQVVASLLPEVRDIRRIGSAALDLCSIASGSLDGYYESGLKVWDFGAGILVASEAGATVLGRSADSVPGTDLLVVAAPSIASPLRALVA